MFLVGFSDPYLPMEQFKTKPLLREAYPDIADQVAEQALHAPDTKVMVEYASPRKGVHPIFVLKVADAHGW